MDRTYLDRINSLKEDDTIKLLDSGETFTIDKIWDGGYVDMTATVPFKPLFGLDYKEKFYSVKIVNFEIL